MWLKQLRRRWLGNPSSPGRGGAGRHHPRGRPGVERLEERAVPTTFPTVASGDVTTLRADLLVAATDHTADVINLAANGTYDLTDALPTAAGPSGLVVTGTANVTINGNGSTIVRDGAAAPFRLWFIDSGTTVVMNSLTLTDGEVAGAGTAAQGAGLFDNGARLTLTGVTVKNDFAVGNHGDAATKGRGFDAQGGGLYANGGNLTLNNSSFLHDAAAGGDGTTTGAGAGAAGGNAQGGGAYVSGATLTVTNSIFGAAATNAPNFAAGGAGRFGGTPSRGGDGGSGQGGGLYALNSNVTISGSFLGNGVNSNLFSNVAAGGTG
ncbi:MAG TPA: hypothetical protein VFW33_22605, partial [Gemmataceae bacterium]|nr:hypothetical protein [Gemmataceae bacterium]